MAQFLLGLLTGILLFLITGLFRFTWNELAATKRLFRHIAPNLVYAGASALLLAGTLFLMGVGDVRRIRSLADIPASNSVAGFSAIGVVLAAIPFLMKWLIDLVILLKAEEQSGAKKPTDQKSTRELPEDAPRWRYRPLRRSGHGSRWTTRVQ